MLKTVTDSFAAPFRVMGTGARWLSDIHSATWLLNLLAGKEEVPPDASSTVKGVHGILGTGDERAFEILLSVLEKEMPGGRKIIREYLDWAFPNDGTAWGKAVSWFYLNRFRTFVLGLGSGEGSKIGYEETRETTRDPDTGAQKRTVNRKDIMTAGSNHPLEFLERMVATIKSVQSRADGRRKLAKELAGERNLTPKTPDDVEDIFRDIERTVKDLVEKAALSLESLETALKNRLARRRGARSGFVREWHRRCFG